jgi:myo-inositol 2-dehydrogenase / D-chiro-inositol 1-dehydrogenase
MTAIRFGVIGLGRMGALHAENLSGMIKGARIVAAAVESADIPGMALERRGFDVGFSAQDLVDRADVDAVLIASPSSLHPDHIGLAALAGKPVFCEKPMAATAEGALDAHRAVTAAGIPFQMGFQRRFDPGYVRAKSFISAGEIGRPEMFRGVSCDHIPPLGYLRTSGGLFWDLGIHDFDAARFLMADDIVEVHAAGAVLVEPALRDIDDADYGVVTIRFASGALGVVQNSWRATWGYEIRAEVSGSLAKVVTELDEKAPVRLYTERGFLGERHHLFVERFREAYRSELQAFVDALCSGAKPSPTVDDALRAIEIADAATRSRREGRWIAVESAAAG